MAGQFTKQCGVAMFFFFPAGTLQEQLLTALTYRTYSIIIYVLI